MSRLRIVDIAPLGAATPPSARRWARRSPRPARATASSTSSGTASGPETLATLDAECRRFFALPEAEKAEIAMPLAGPAWRGWFPLGGELTSGRPDQKEGLYFGEELGPDDPRVVGGWPMHGANLWPARPPGLRAAVEAYMRETVAAAHRLAEGVSLALGLEADFLHRRYTRRPTVLFRVFRYPAGVADPAAFGVGEHTDYGFLTLLAQTRAAGWRCARRADGSRRRRSRGRWSATSATCWSG
jgi:isopenicillin N synthase-like dioxygenase